MNKLFIRDKSANSLIVVFLGWGFPPESFSGLRKNGFDILLLAGYENVTGVDIEHEIQTIVKEHHDWQNPRYDEVVVIGWSFGVKVATLFLSQTDMPVTMRLAVNGTEFHIDDSKGIPETVFNGTLSGLSGKTLEKFRLRSAGSKEKLDKLGLDAVEEPSPKFSMLRKELEWFGSLPPIPTVANRSIWDKVIVGDEDRIFPPANQLRAWEGYDIFPVNGMSHIPDFQWIIDNFVVDKQKVCDKFETAVHTYTDNAIAQQTTARNLYDKFSSVFLDSKTKSEETIPDRKLSVLELGYGDGTFTRMYAPGLIRHCQSLSLVDINGNRAEANIAEYLHDCDKDRRCRIEFYHEDAESAELAGKCLLEKSKDLIFSSSMFQWLNSPATMLRRCDNALRDNGIMAISFYGPGTFREITTTVGTGLKYPSPEWMRRIAEESGLHVELLETEEETIRFDTPAEALRHLKLTGVNALPVTSSPTKARHLLNHWPLDEDGKATLTFRPVYMILSKKQS